VDGSGEVDAVFIGDMELAAASAGGQTERGQVLAGAADVDTVLEPLTGRGRADVVAAAGCTVLDCHRVYAVDAGRIRGGGQRMEAGPLPALVVVLGLDNTGQTVRTSEGS